MGDVGEYWRDVKAYYKDKRAANPVDLNAIPKRLRALGYEFEIKNEGHHLIVKTKHGIIDLWPSRERWIARKKKKEGFTFRSFLDYCE